MNTDAIAIDASARSFGLTRNRRPCDLLVFQNCFLAINLKRRARKGNWVETCLLGTTAGCCKELLFWSLTGLISQICWVVSMLWLLTRVLCVFWSVAIQLLGSKTAFLACAHSSCTAVLIVVFGYFILKAQRGIWPERGLVAWLILGRFLSLQRVTSYMNCI